jgi:hypothetical protein
MDDRRGKQHHCSLAAATPATDGAAFGSHGFAHDRDTKKFVARPDPGAYHKPIFSPKSCTIEKTVKHHRAGDDKQTGDNNQGWKVINMLIFKGLL